MKYILFLFILNLSVFASGGPDLKPVDHKILNMIYNYQLDEAETLIDKFLKEDPDNLKYHYLFMNVGLVKNTKLRDEAPMDKKDTVKDSLQKMLIKYAENLIDKYEDRDLTVDEKFYLGSIHGFLGRFYGVDGSWMAAFSNGKTGRNMMEEIIELHPDYNDAYLLPGMLNYYADRLGGFIGFVAAILGFSGDRAEGLKYLKRAADDGVLTKPIAIMLLAETYDRMESNEFDSLPYFEQMYKLYPGNLHFVNWYCRTLLELNDLQKVKQIIENDSLGNIYPYVKASYYGAVGEYVKSNEMLKTVLNEDAGMWRWLLENAKMQKFKNHFLLNEIEEAKKAMKDLSERNIIAADRMFEDMSLTKEMIKFKMDVGLNNEDDVKDFVKSYQDVEDKYYQAFYNFHLGEYNYRQRNYSGAQKYFKEAIRSFPEAFSYDSYKYLIHIYKISDVAENDVENLIDEIEENDYDRLEFSVRDLSVKYNL
ncbi:MAG: hypothetical protein K9J16_05055 [Melioribacteraceae bacterium]|nr:hypothetical protein [Melioribacteraceae bacterium]MCF8354213.1 hypothetical protein [Melioribacteraceae bacterium]MCF8392859.1 hypothetical protein [Melioribacteraceae bacterium]MCF8418655.1 hypothetical protein [Melioribacteraceae bacterium]